MASFVARAKTTMHSTSSALMATDPFGQGALAFVGAGYTQKTTTCIHDKHLPRFSVPLIGNVAETVLAAARCWLGVIPRDALKSLPDFKTLGSGLKPTIADAISGRRRDLVQRPADLVLPLARAIVLSRSSIFRRGRRCPRPASRLLARLFGKGLVGLRERQRFLQPVNALRHDQAEFREMPAQRVDGHGSLLDQRFPVFCSIDAVGPRS